MMILKSHQGIMRINQDSSHKDLAFVDLILCFHIYREDSKTGILL